MAPPHTSPQKNSRISAAAHSRTPSSRSAQRITKPKQNRGRPIKYADACIKRLLLLRACGVTNLEIIALVGGRITERTIQDFAKQYLGEPDERYGGPSEDDARRQISILKKLLKKSNEERTSKPRRKLLPPTSRTKRLSMTCTRLGDSLRHSISSSFLRAIDRFSWSSRGSASTATTFGLDRTPPQYTTAKLISERTKLLTDAQNKLNETCCGNWYEASTSQTLVRPLCIHIRILTLMEADVKDTDEVWIKMYDELYSCYSYNPRIPLSTDPNADLFFVTRVGAPLRVVEAFMGRADNIHVLNEDGQNFLFFLNPRTFEHATCTCKWIRPHIGHVSPFVCLIQTLEKHNFDFEHVDDDGRTFLSFLLAFVPDPEGWLLELIGISSIWQKRLDRPAESNDSSGFYLADLMSQIEPTSLLSLRIPRGRDGAHAYWRTKWQQYVRTNFLRTEVESPLPFHTSVIKVCINYYSTDGRTPMIEFLVEAMNNNMPSSVICHKLDILVQSGANVHARSSGGQTALHFAAGRARAKVIAYLLEKGIQKDHRDDFGRTAYHYAWNLFNKSQKRDVKALQSARAFQALIVLDEDRKRGSARSNVHRRSEDICRMLSASAMMAEDSTASGFLRLHR